MPIDQPPTPTDTMTKAVLGMTESSPRNSNHVSQGPIQRTKVDKSSSKQNPDMQEMRSKPGSRTKQKRYESIRQRYREAHTYIDVLMFLSVRVVNAVVD